MSNYKVIQDIEAEDKLLGPLTLRQFIYAIVVVVSGFIMFKLTRVNWLFSLLLLPETLFFAVLAAPFGHDQPNEVWLLAKVRFFFKPRKRVWNQSGVQELVTITVPKKVEHRLTNGLSQSEVKSRLQALASTIDSHGWSVKNVNVNLYGPQPYAVESDRLINPSALPKEVNTTDVTATDDMLDEQNNPNAQSLDRMMTASAQNHREQIVSQLQQPAPATPVAPADTGAWFLSQNQAGPAPKVILPEPASAPDSGNSLTEAEQALLEKLHTKPKKKKKGDNTSASTSHMRTILPLSEQPEPADPSPLPSPQPSTLSPQPSPMPPPSVTAPPNPAIIQLASNDDLNVATIARQANKTEKKEPPRDEVVVSLH